MKSIISKSSFIPVIAAVMISTFSGCTKLEEEFIDSRSEFEPSQGATSADLSGVYNQLNQMVGQANWYALQEHTTDEMLGPTRGTDWDDFGTWRKLHLHTWDGVHNQIFDTWNGMNGAVFQANVVAELGASAADKAQGRFLRAFFVYQVMDLWGQVPFRDIEDTFDDIPRVMTRSEAFDFIMADLDAAIPGLASYSTNVDRHFATKEAAKFLKAKLLLNKAVYKADPNNPAGPFTFEKADMDQVIALVNEITATGKFDISANYWDNFKWDNGTVSKEIIFSRNTSKGVNLQWATNMGFHYNQTPSGWNGFTTLSDFYNSFDADDERRGVNLPGYTDVLGHTTGFLVGQIRGPRNGQIVNLTDRSGSPLVFTPDVSLFYSTEAKGIRVVKYPLDPAKLNSDSPNDFVFFRYADALLMKAEAALRGGTSNESALAIVNNIRTIRGTETLGSLNLEEMLAERGREMYFEGWRRNDMIRFERFNAPVQERTQASDPSRVVFAIPVQAVSTNPNLKQNVGY
jgi:starch-binding outer membrane protein, SusD/RagB family